MLATLAWRGTEVDRTTRVVAARAVRRNLRAPSRARQSMARHSGLRVSREPRRGWEGRDPRVLRRGPPARRASACARSRRCSQRRLPVTTTPRPPSPSRASPDSTSPLTTCAGTFRPRCRRCSSRSIRCSGRGARSTEASLKPREHRMQRWQVTITAPNRITLDGAQVDVGFSVDLTIDPALQALAQKTAACYTGRQDVCRSLGVHRGEDGTEAVGHRMLEHAVVRMAAIAIIDVASGRIEALAGALSPCTRQEYDGPGREAKCDARLPYAVRYRPDQLLNPAVFHDAMPGSVIKPVMAAAFLSNAERRPALARGRARRDADVCAADARQPARAIDAVGFSALSRSHVLRRPGLSPLRASLGSPVDGERVRLERRVRRAERALRQARPAVRPLGRTPQRRMISRRWPNGCRTAGSSSSRKAESSAHPSARAPRSRSIRRR